MIDLLDLGPVKIRYLERLYDHDQVNSTAAMESGPFLIEECGLSVPAALGLTMALDRIGLIRHCNGLDSPAAWLTDDGRDAVRKIRRYRGNPANRATAARHAVLAHTYEATVKGNGSPDPAGAAECDHAEFVGESLSREELLAAANYLADKGLLTVGGRNASGEAQWVAITASGQDCVEQYEGDVRGYLRHERAAGPTFNGPVFNAAVDGAQLAWNNQTVNQTQNHPPQNEAP